MLGSNKAAFSRVNRVLHKWIQIATLTDMTLLSCFMYCQFAEARRNQQIEQLTKDRKQQHSYQMTEWKRRFIEKQNEATRRAHEDNVKHLQVIFFFVLQGDSHKDEKIEMFCIS